MLQHALTVLALAGPILSVTADVPGTHLPVVQGLTLSEVRIPSSVDGKLQSVVCGAPEPEKTGEKLPLLVGLHTWSANYLQRVGDYGRQAARRGWLMVCPDFRGPNLNTNPAPTEAGGSILAQHDVVDAINYMKAHYPVDDRRIYMVGESGGGHMTCMMAAKYPDLFAACTAWCPVTDLADWFAQKNSYAPHIAAVCGGEPGASPAIDFEYARRSPRTLITNAANVPLYIGHGDKDATIWTEQTWRSYYRLRDVPGHQVIFHSWDAGHEGRVSEGLDWAATKVRSLVPPKRLDLVTDEAKSYFWLELGPSAPLTFGRCTAILVRAGDVLTRDTKAQTTVLTLKATDVAQLRVDLSALGLSAPKTLSEGLRLEGTHLVASPGSGQHEFRAEF